jgi:tetratricopeptide (TPR) repeat protein
MTLRTVVLCLALACVAASATAAPAGPKEDAAGKFAEGNTLLAKGDFEGALRAYSIAAKTDPDSAEYRSQAMLLRRAMQVRQTLDTLKDQEKWLSTARALYSFYYDYEVFAEALSLALKVHAKEMSGESAAMVARTRLALGMNAEAFAGLRGLSPKQVTPEVCVLTGIALARRDQTAEARAVLEDFEEPKEAAGALWFDLARLHALLGNTDDALRMLGCCFENTSPGRIERMRTAARCSEDFAGLRDNPGFAPALATESKIKGGCCAGRTPGSCKASCSEKQQSECAKKAADSGQDHDPQNKPKP